MKTTKPKSGRGALYMVWGEKADRALARSIASLKRVHPDMPLHVERIDRSDAGLLCKCGMFNVTPFSETLFLDADTVVLGDLTFAFDKAARFGLACCISTSVWGRQHLGIEGDTIEYNTGVLFFAETAKPVFDTCLQLSPAYAGRGRASYTGPGTKTVGEHQGPFAAALEATGFNPFVLPPNWNFRPGMGHRDIVGPIKIWHHYADPPLALLDPNFGADLTHAKMEDLFPLQRQPALRLSWKLFRHALGLRKRPPAFPDVDLSFRAGERQNVTSVIRTP
jgi:hypothetical protein